MEKKLFEEVQKFNQIIIIVPVIMLGGIALWSIVQQLIMGIPFGNNPVSDLGLVVILFFMALIIALLLSMRLKVTIYPDRIEYQFWPFQMKVRIIEASEIDEVHIRKYNAMREFKGYGIKFSKEGRAFTTKGDRGIQIITKQRGKVLIGTQKPELAGKAIAQLHFIN